MTRSARPDTSGESARSGGWGASIMLMAMIAGLGVASNSAAQTSPAGMWDASVVVNTAPAGAEPVRD